MTKNLNLLFNLGAALLLLVGAFVLATPEPAFACDGEIHCFEVCWINADGSFGCGAITCICI